MPVRIVQSKQNARLKELRRALAKPERKAGGLVAIEGPHLVEEALRAGLKIACVFVGETMQHWLQQISLPPETEALVMPWGILVSILSVSTERPQAVAALVEPPAWDWDHLFFRRRNTVPLILVLAGLQDPGNLGTILRSAEAFGATGIVSLTGTVSAWNLKAIRASAGSVFRVPFISSTADECIALLRENGVKIWTTAVHDTEPAPGINLAAPVALLIGNEGNGVPAELAAKADGALTIPCPGPVESLNAAVATSVLLYEAAQQRAAKGVAR
jgi:RNA methyltransferase, TrmH family